MSMLQLHVLTIFPEILISPLQESILKRAQEKRLVRIDLHNLRQYTTDLHRTTDDAPYGGGPGMIMKAEPLVHGLDQLRTEVPELHTILTCPQGRLFTQQRARELAGKEALLFVCGRYGGVDDRVRAYVDEEMSIGDYVLTGGELAALVMMDAIIRLVPGGWAMNSPQMTTPSWATSWTRHSIHVRRCFGGNRFLRCCFLVIISKSRAGVVKKHSDGHCIDVRSCFSMPHSIRRIVPCLRPYSVPHLVTVLA